VRVLTDYAGRRIRLTDERIEHILAEHPEMARVEAVAAETLAEPERVVVSPTDPESMLYYRSYVATAVGDKLACVVVARISEDPFVLTAYLTDRAKKGDVAWPTE
jgi:hypothetical protein